MKHDNRYVWLDLARGVSALLVCAGHLRGAMFIDYNSNVSPDVMDSLFYFFTSLGHPAVMVFFVLSGFFVGGSVISRGNGFHVISYLIAQLTRLWVVLIPALVFTFFIDQILKAISPDVLSGDFYSVLSSGPKAGSYSDSIDTFFFNVIFLQNIYMPIFGSNGPLWSLANEFWYYMLFPLIFIAIDGGGHTSLQRFVSLLVAIALLLTVASDILEGFIVWLFGVCVYQIYEQTKIRHSSWFAMMAGALFVVSIADSKLLWITKYTGVSSDLLIGFSFALLLISIGSTSIKWCAKEIACGSKWLSEISYTLYLTYFPVVMLIFAACYQKEQVILTASTFSYFIGWLIVLQTIAVVMWWFFERKTQTVRLVLQKHLTCS